MKFLIDIIFVSFLLSMSARAEIKTSVDYVGRALTASVLGSSSYYVGVGRKYTTIQSALNAIGNSVDVSGLKSPQTVIIQGGVYDEDLIIPRGRIISLISEGTVILGNGLGTNWDSTNSRNITVTYNNADVFGSDIKPALNISPYFPGDATSTFLAEASNFRISGGLIIAGDGLSHTINLSGVKINGTITKTTAGLTNLQAYRSYFKGAITASSTILERIEDCQFDGLISVDGYNLILNSEIKAGMTVLTNYNTLPPSGIFFSTLTGVFTSPALGIKLDTASDYFFTQNGATLAGSASKVIISNYIKKGTLSIFVTDNGDYANGQAAIDAAPAGAVLFFGPKAGGWGNIVLKPDVDVVGLGATQSINIQFGTITFSPTTGNISTNTVFVSNISASVGTGSSLITIGGTAPSRVKFFDCYFSKTAGAEDAVSITNTQAGSSVYFIRSSVDASGATGNVINSSSPYLKGQYLEISGGTKAFVQTAGLSLLDKADIEYAQTASIINVVAGSLIVSDSLIRNLGTNSSGVNVSTGATFAIDQTTFDVSAGTGYAVNGIGVFAYGRVTFADIPILNPRNVKFQSTLIIANYTLTPTLAP
jgi:hypothetical protein